MKLWDLEEIIEGSNGNASGAAEDSDSDNDGMDLDNDPKPSKGIKRNLHNSLEHLETFSWQCTSLIMISSRCFLSLVQVARGKQKAKQIQWTTELSSQTCSFCFRFILELCFVILTVLLTDIIFS